MVAKVLGLASGALVASVAVWGFNTWRHVSDDDLLVSVLADHCLPFVETGAVPFDGMGRTPGVYDAVNLREQLEGGSAVLLFDNRFVVQWGISRDPSDPENNAVRICDVAASYGANTVAGFVVDADGFIDRYTKVIAANEALVPEIEVLEDGPRTLGWYGANRAPSEGLRVIMIASPGLVSSVLVMKDLKP